MRRDQKMIFIQDDGINEHKALMRDGYIVDPSVALKFYRDKR
jgi:hypothetical protein